MKKWEQFEKYLCVLEKAYSEDLENEFIISGIIDKFYIQFELGWKVLKELLKYEGAKEAISGSPREIIKTAYMYFDFIEETVWLEMLRDRNDATHMYNEEAAQNLVEKILNKYIAVFVRMSEGIKQRYGESLPI